MDADDLAPEPDESQGQEATADLRRMIDNYGQVSMTVRDLLNQFGYDELTAEAQNSIYDHLREAGLSEDPSLTKPGVTLESKVKIKRTETAKQQQERFFIWWGFVTAIILAPVGIFFGIRLLVRERIGPGIAVILVAIAAWGTGIVIVLAQNGSGPAAKHYDAHDTTLQHEVEERIETGDSNGKTTVSGVSCVAESSATMTCLGTVRSGFESGQATYKVTVDTNTGHYIVSPPEVSLNGG